MTTPVVRATAGARSGYRITPSTIALLGVGALAWVGVLAVTRHMGNGTGTMGLSFGEFLVMWSLMMAAMMLPAVAPVASMYARTFTEQRARRTAVFAAGYIAVWVVVSVPAYVALRGVDELVDSEGQLRALAFVVLAIAGVYQLTPLKRVCIRHCRSPLGQLLHYGSVTGRAKELRVAIHHACFCLGCCWALMALFLAFGVMNVWVMIGLAAVVVAEKLLRNGEGIGQLAGVAFLVLAVTLALSPSVSDALLPMPAEDVDMTDMADMGM